MGNGKRHVDCTVIVEGFRSYLDREVAAGAIRPNTARNYGRAAERLANAWPTQDILSFSDTQLRRWYDSLKGDGLSNKTVREIQIGLRRFYRWAHDRGYAKRNPTAAIKLMDYSPPVMGAYSLSDIKALIAGCNTRTRSGARDAAMITMLFDSGVRLGELISMRVTATWREGVIEVRGKTGPRMAYYSSHTVDAVSHMIILWGLTEGAAMWPGTHGALKESGAYQAIERLCYRTGVQFQGVHAFRRSMAIEMSKAGADQVALQRVGGWKSPVMVLRYTASARDELGKQAHARFAPATALLRRGRK